jgi:ornithine cyclodeaminase
MAALEAGYARPKGPSDGSYIAQGEKVLMTRTAWIDGLGALVKTITYCPKNGEHGLHPVQGSVSLFDDATGQVVAQFDPDLITQWKTAADSVLAARRLAHESADDILVLGAGRIANALIEAYRAAYPEARISVWNRTAERARDIAAKQGIRHAQDLQAALQQADIISSATGAITPILRGADLRPGQHLDLVGSFFPNAREADDAALSQARIFVNCKQAALGGIGEIALPMASGTITEGDLLADHYAPSRMLRDTPTEITLFKNCGSTHANLITAAYMARVALS